MAIMRRLYKTSTAKMLSFPCFPSLADLIVLSGVLSLESPSSLYITYSYGYHQKAWQNQHCKNAYLMVSSLSLSLLLIWSHWVNSFRWKSHHFSIHIKTWQNRQRWNFNLAVSSPTDWFDRIEWIPFVGNFVFLIYYLFLWLLWEGFTKPALLKCFPCRAFPRWLIWSYWVDYFRWNLRLPHIYYLLMW